jgi:hypothetical protein
MSTGDKSINIYLKKFLSQQELVENFQELHEKLIKDLYRRVYKLSGLFKGGILSSSAPNTFDVETPSEGTDSQGNDIVLDPLYASALAFENTLNDLYYVGLRMAVVPVDVETNVRTGKLKYIFNEDVVGVRADPDDVIDNLNGTIKLIVDSITEPGVSNAGRKVRVFLKTIEDGGLLGPLSLVQPFEELIVQWDGTNNFVQTTTGLGQLATNISVDENDYQVVLMGPTVKKNTDLRTIQEVIFLGIITGAGAGNSPSVFDQTDLVYLSSLSPEPGTGLAAALSTLLEEGGTIAHSDVTPGLISWSSALKIRPFGTDQVITVNAGSITLADDEVAYVALPSEFTTQTLPMSKTSRDSATLMGLNNFWVFHRHGSLIACRGGMQLEQGEQRQLADIVIGNAVFFSNDDKIRFEEALNVYSLDADNTQYAANLALLDSVFFGNPTGNNKITYNAGLFAVLLANSVEGSTISAGRHFGQRALITDLVFEALVTGEVESRYSQSADGTMYWSDGTNPADVSMLREAIGKLKVIGAFAAEDDVLTEAGTIYKKASGVQITGVNASLNEVFDETLNRKLLKVIPNNPADTILDINPSYILLADGSKYALPLGPLLSNYAGGSINFETGIITGGGANFTPADFTGNLGGWFKYSLNLLPSNEVLVLSADGFGASQSLAPEPPLSEDAIAFAIIAVQHDVGGGVTDILPLTESNITRIPVGGSGGGSGDASTLLSRLEDMVDESFYRYLEPNVFSKDKATKLLSTTGSYSYVTKTYDFDAGEELVSIELLDAEFLSELVDVMTVQVALIFESGFEDTAPVVEISRNGGGEYQPVTMEQVGESDTFVGTLVIEAEAAKQNLHEYALANADADLVIDATTNQSRSQEFTAAQYEVLEKITAYVNKLGSPTGYLYIRLVKDNAGSPSTDGADVLTELIVNIATLVAGDNTIALDIGKRVLANTQKVHLVFATDTEYKTGFSAGVTELRVKADSSAPSIADSKSYNGTVWAAVAGNALVHKIEGRELDLRLRYTASMASKLKGYGVLYGAEFESITRLKKRAQFVFNGTLDNLNEFPLPFDCDPDFLKCHHVYNGQYFLVPAFQLQGNKAVFPVNFFSGEEVVHLVFAQSEYGSYEASSDAKKLIAENHLGSSDNGLDYSAAGRGPKVRTKTTAILVELTVSEDYELEIKEA